MIWHILEGKQKLREFAYLQEGLAIHGVEDDSGENQGEKSAEHQSHSWGRGLNERQQS